MQTVRYSRQRRGVRRENPYVETEGEDMMSQWMARSTLMERGGADMASWPSVPDGLIPLKTYSDRNGYYITLTQELQQTGLDSDDYLFFDYREDVDVIGGSGVEPPENYDPNTDPERPIQDNLGDGRSYRVTLPRQLVEYDLGIDPEDYDGEEPFLLKFYLIEPKKSKEKRTAFGLDPLGYAGDVFRNPNRYDLPSPIPDELANQYAQEFDLVPRDLRGFLAELADWVDHRTLETLGIESLAPMMITGENSHEVAVEYLPRGSIGAITDLFGAPPEHIKAAFALHFERGFQLTEAAYAADGERLPADHPLAGDTEEVEAFVIPQTEQIQAGIGGGNGRATVPPVTREIIRQVIALIPVDQDTLKGALSTLADALEVTDDQVGIGGEPVATRLREPVVLPITPGYHVEAGYNQVHIEFVPSGAGEKVAQEGLATHNINAEELASAVQSAYNRQAERLLRDADVDDRLARFQGKADAVLIPADDG